MENILFGQIYLSSNCLTISLKQLEIDELIQYILMTHFAYSLI